jgi:hypothetical protein
LVSALRAPPAPAALNGMALAGLCAAGLAWGGGSPPVWAYALAGLAGLVAGPFPRLAYVLGVGGLASWLGFGVDQPGAAVLFALLGAPGPLLLVREGRAWLLPSLAPLLGAAGLAPLYAGVAGLFGSATRRATLAAIGYVWLLAAESATGFRLLFDPLPHAPRGWESSVGSALDPLAGLFTTPALLGALLWVAAALALPLAVRGRELTSDLVGAVVWSAALVALTRLLAEGPLPAQLPPAPAVGAALVAGVLGLRWLYPPADPAGGAAGGPSPGPRQRKPGDGGRGDRTRGHGGWGTGGRTRGPSVVDDGAGGRRAEPALALGRRRGAGA